MFGRFELRRKMSVKKGENRDTDEIKEEVRGDLFSYWNDLNDAGELPKNYKELGFRRREDFRKMMEGKFPWLHLCKGHWKAQQLWINHFSSWKKSHLPPSPDSKNSPPSPGNPKSKTPIEILLDDSENLEGQTPISISSDSSEVEFLGNPDHETPVEISSDEGESPTGSKRRHEDSNLDSGPSKRSKGKGKEVATPGPHSAQPKPKKINAKIGKVNSTFLFIGRLLKIFRTTHCTQHFRHICRARSLTLILVQTSR